MVYSTLAQVGSYLLVIVTKDHRQHKIHYTVTTHNCTLQCRSHRHRQTMLGWDRVNVVRKSTNKTCLIRKEIQLRIPFVNEEVNSIYSTEWPFSMSCFIKAISERVVTV